LLPSIWGRQPGRIGHNYVWAEEKMKKGRKRRGAITYRLSEGRAQIEPIKENVFNKLKLTV